MLKVLEEQIALSEIKDDAVIVKSFEKILTYSKKLKRNIQNIIEQMEKKNQK